MTFATLSGLLISITREYQMKGGKLVSNHVKTAAVWDQNGAFDEFLNVTQPMQHLIR